MSPSLLRRPALPEGRHRLLVRALARLRRSGRFDDAMRRYPGRPAGVPALCLSLVMLGLIDSVALAPLAVAASVVPGAEIGVRAGLALVAPPESRPPR